MHCAETTKDNYHQFTNQPAGFTKGAGTNMKVVGHVSIRREAPEKNFYRAPPTFYTVPP